MNQAIDVRDTAALMERAVIQGDLSALTPAERVEYYTLVCDSLGLNKFTKPFRFLALKDDRGEPKLELYATTGCTDQLRDIKRVSITKLEKERADGLYIVTAYAVDGKGRTDSAIAAVPIVKEQGEWKSTTGGKRYFEGNGRFLPIAGEALANAVMKCESKAKRRVTLSLCGLGMPTEDDVEGQRQEIIPVDLDAEPAAAPRVDAARYEEVFGSDATGTFFDIPEPAAQAPLITQQTAAGDVCAECGKPARAQTGQPLTATQRNLLLERFGTILCRECRSPAPAAAPAA